MHPRVISSAGRFALLLRFPLLLAFLAAAVLLMASPARAADKFTATGSMSTSRAGHTATLLQNGKVLVAGGFNNTNITQAHSTVELYDPATGNWSAT